MSDNHTEWWEAESLRAMSTAHIRKNQDLVAQQIKIAHSTGNVEALEMLRGWEDGYTNEMYRRLMEDQV